MSVKTMESMRLTVEVPVISVYTERWGRSRGHFIYTTVPLCLETLVHGLRRAHLRGDVADESLVRALAFIPVMYRREIPKSAWVDAEHAWVDCRLADNKKSLAAFVDSSDLEWRVESAES